MPDPCDTDRVVADPIARIDEELRRFLDERTRELARIDPRAPEPAKEIRRLVDAGGKRIRPAFCYWGYRAGGGSDDPRILRAAAALELLHTMAIVHDDLMDGAKERRGVPATAPWFSDRASALGAPGDPEDFGRSMAVLVGDLAAVWADLLLLTSGFEADALLRAQAEYHAMRERMAAGQVLDVAGAAREPEVARRAASLRGGAYTVEGPLRIGAALAGATDHARERLGWFGRPLGEAFQLRDDLEDGEAPPGVTRETVNALVGEAERELDPAELGAEPSEALRGLADRVAM
jgi:geranylgeranyl diphosphate synthase type I